MSVDSFMTPLSRCAVKRASNPMVALHRGQWLAHSDFSGAVANAANALSRHPDTAYALYHEQAYPFAVMLFAAWHSGKTVWLAANNTPATAAKLKHQGCRLLGDWPNSLDVLTIDLDKSDGKVALTELDLNRTGLVVFTSGSTGEPKAIKKALWQLNSEVLALERQWGMELSQAQALATVGHQHIYGLLFRVLWPLASGRGFHSSRYFNPEALLSAGADTPSYWVASPGQLKRLDEQSPWAAIKDLTLIFSSGGKLAADVAEQIHIRGEQNLVEIYGSSETGGIAWRIPVKQTQWQPFPGIGISVSDDRRCRLTSPYLPADVQYPLDDNLELHESGRFNLLERSDRIVKVEEKRLSLVELEQALQQAACIAQAHCWLWTGNRDRVTAVAALTAQGLEHLQLHGKVALIKQLKESLTRQFEAVVLPKRWLFMNRLPLTPQSKIDQGLLNSLLSLSHQTSPQLVYCQQNDNGVELSLHIPARLVYFPGHFPTYPILPGVTQLAWAELYGKLFFTITQPFLRLEAVKFKKIIRPGGCLTLTLQWHQDTGKLFFDFTTETESHSSGRLVYGAAQ